MPAKLPADKTENSKGKEEVRFRFSDSYIVARLHYGCVA